MILPWLPVMVGTRGFEPPASPTPKVRATPAPRPVALIILPLAEQMLDRLWN